MDEVGLLRYEEPVESYDDFCCDADLPIKPLLINFGSVHVVDPATLRADMEAVPKFDWPEREAAEGNRARAKQIPKPRGAGPQQGLRPKDLGRI